MMQARNILPKAGRPQLILALALGLAAMLQLATPLNHDAAWHFTTSFKWLEGARIGHEVFDINPPMTLWLSSLPAVLVSLTGWDPVTVFKLFILLIAGFVFLLSDFLLGSVSWRRPQRTWFRLFLALALFILPAYDFAQREHMAAMLLTPYVLLAAMRVKGLPFSWQLAALSGLLAAVGMGIKPYFVAVIICVELALLVWRRRPGLILRPELLALAVTSLVYLLAILMFAPGYYTQVLPAALSNYGGFNVSGAVLAERIVRELAVPVLALMILFLTCFRSRQSAIFLMLLAAAAGFLLAAIAQKKGWAYQLFPAKYFLVLALGVLLGALSELVQFRRVAPVAGLVLALWLAATPLVPFLREMHGPNTTRDRIDRLAGIFTEEAGADGSVFAFITSPRDIHPAILQSRTRWAGAAGAMVYLPAYLGPDLAMQPAADANVIRQTAQQHDRAMITRLAASRPDVIVSQSGPGRLGLEGVEMSYPVYFSQYPEFRALWSHYELRERVGSFEIYVLKK